MFIQTDIVLLGGKFEKTEKSVAEVSFWYIPKGYQVDCANVVLLYFDDLEKARTFEKKYEMSPEMACLTIIQ